MAIKFVCSMDQYGASGGENYGGENDETSGWNLLNDIMFGDGWTNQPSYLNDNFRYSPTGTYTIDTPSWGARQGDYALMANGVDIVNDDGSLSQFQTRPASASMQMAIPGDTAAVRTIHVAYSCSALPVERGHGYIALFCDSNGEIRGGLRVNTAGRLEVVDGTPLRCEGGQNGYTTQPTVLATSSSAVIAANTWYSLNIRLTANPGGETVDAEIWVGDISDSNKVIDVDDLAFTDQSLAGQPASTENNIDIIGWLPASLSNLHDGSADTNIRAIRDIVFSDSSGTYNTNPLGQVFTSAQEMRAMDGGGGWTAHTREDIGNGILNAHTNNTGIRLPDNAEFEIGSSAFTFESRVRFSSIPTEAGEEMVLLSKWFESSNQSYRLYYDADSAGLVWDISTNGSTTTTVKNVPWVPLLDRWYSLAVVRNSNLLYFFVDGVQIGTPIADSNTYFNGTGSLGIGADFQDGSTPDSATAFDGYLDETRFTVGTGRYTSDYTPLTVEFGRDGGSDANFANVSLLMGYDDGTIVDESGTGHTLTINASPVTADEPGDGDFPYQVLNQRPGWDDTYVEASHLFAEGIFTFDALPVADETMTVGSITYTWKGSLDGANQVLIGSDIAECITNIIAAINNGVGEGTLYGTGTVANTDAVGLPYLNPQFSVRAISIGDAGNSIATTETMTNGSFGAATLEGGQDISADSDFSIERLPIDVSGILGVQATTRAYKTDAGTADIRLDLVGPAAGVAAGAPLAADLNPSWRRQVFEEDPDTAASITPSTIIGGRLRFKRTS